MRYDNGLALTRCHKERDWLNRTGQLRAIDGQADPSPHLFFRGVSRWNDLNLGASANPELEFSSFSHNHSESRFIVDVEIGNGNLRMIPNRHPRLHVERNHDTRGRGRKPVFDYGIRAWLCELESSLCLALWDSINGMDLLCRRVFYINALRDANDTILVR